MLWFGFLELSQANFAKNPLNSLKIIHYLKNQVTLHSNQFLFS